MFVLEWIDLGEFIPLGLLIGLLYFIGSQVSGDDPRIQRWSRAVSVLSFVAYAVAGISAWGAWNATELLLIVIRAMFAAGIVLGIARIVLPFAVFMYQQLTPSSVPREIEPSPPPPNPEPSEAPPTAPPPTREEIAATALTAYEARLKVVENANLDEAELHAAKLKAKQQYLKELDQAIS
jgi:hypothetical protein